MSTDVIPERAALFPLNTVLFPGCELPLKIFEQRYLRLVRECMRDETGFVVVLIREGSEIGNAPQIYSTGTWVRITDWETLDNGLLGITITADQRVRVDRPSAQDDGLLTAAVHALPYHVEEADLLGEYDDLAETLKQLEQHPWAQQFSVEIDYTSAADINNKLSYLLPVSGLDKQALLEIDDCRDHCEQLRYVILQLQNLGQN